MSEKKSGLFSLIWKGALFGIANIIPGVSGGTMAVVTGVYDEFMEAIAHFIKKRNFLFFYLAGAGIGIVGAAFILEDLFERWPQPTLFTFMGFILGGIPMLVKKGRFEKKLRLSWGIGFLIAFALIIVMGFMLNPAESEPITVMNVQTGLMVFFSGIAAASAMIIPGISGSFLLLLFGMYTTFVGAVTDMNFPILIAGGAGVGTGVMVVSRLISFCLNRYHSLTYSVILGLVSASAIALWPGFSFDAQGIFSVLFFVAGLIGGYKLGD